MRGSDLVLRLKLSTNPELLSVVRSALMDLAGKLGFRAADCRALTRAVDEALANIIQHAYKGRPGHPIELLCRRIVDRSNGQERVGLEIVLQDQGVCADRKKLCGRPFDDIRPGGLGMHFIQEGVDVMQYSRRAGRNRLRLVKYLPAAGHGLDVRKEE